MMKNTPIPPATVAEYIDRWDPHTRAVLRKLRATIRKAAPEAEERLSYRMPAYFMKRVLVYFAAWEKHIGLYPGARAIEVFKDDIARYVHAKGSIQFPLARPLPIGLITKIVRFRVKMIQDMNAPRRRRAATKKKTTNPQARHS